MESCTQYITAYAIFMRRSNDVFKTSDDNANTLLCYATLRCRFARCTAAFALSSRVFFSLIYAWRQIIIFVRYILFTTLNLNMPSTLPHSRVATRPQRPCLYLLHCTHTCTFILKGIRSICMLYTTRTRIHVHVASELNPVNTCNRSSNQQTV